MEHNQETVVGLLESVITNCVQRSLADIAPWSHFQFAKNIIISETVCGGDEIAVDQF